MNDRPVDSSIGRVAAGAGWLYGYRWVERLLDFVAVVVLARLLSPDDFGLVAIAASIVAIIDGLAAFDVHKALIRRPDADQALYDSAWTLALARGVLSALIMVSMAPFFSDPRLSTVLCVLALSPLLLGLSNPRFARFETELVYSRIGIQTLTAKVGSFVVTLAVAWVTRSYWALVAGTLVSSLLLTVLSYALRPYRPRPSLRRWRDIFGFSGWLSLTTAVTTLSMETDKLIVGKLLGVTDTGRYYMTQRVGVLPTRELISPLQRILFPSFSALLSDPARLRRVALESVNVLGSLSLPAAVGFALVAPDFVPLVLGDQWLAIVPLLVILVPYLGVRATLAMTLPCVLALGRTRLLFGVSLAYALVHVPLFVAGTAVYGLVGAIWSLVLAGVVYSGLNVWMLHRTLAIRLREILGQLVRPTLASAILVVGLLLFDGTVGASLSGWLSLGVRVPLGALLYGVALWAQWAAAGKPAGLETRLQQLWDRPRS